MKISEMTTAPTLSDSDLLELAQVDGSEESGYSTRKTTILAIGNRVNNQQTYTSDLQTTSKTIIGAINELAQGGGGGGSDVEVTPILTEGTKIATISVDDVESDIYAENPREVFNDMSEIKSVTGNPATLTCEEKTCAKKALVTFSPKQSGTGDPSPSNIRPFILWDGLELTRTGKNLFDKATAKNNTYVSGSTGVEVATNGLYCSDFIRVKTGNITTNTVSTGVSKIVIYKADKTIKRSTSQLPVTIASDECYIRINGKTSDISIDEVQVEFGSTATAYEPYDAETHTATFPSTEYGGEYDFVEGRLTDELVLFTATEAFLYGNYGVDNAPLYYVEIPTGISIKTRPSTGYDGHLYSNYFIETNASGATYMADGECRTNAGTPNRIYFRWDSAEDLSAINTAFANTPLQIVGVRTTPTEISLTPSDVELNKGTNIVSTDGDGLSVDYTEIATLDDMKILINATVGSVLNTEF